MKYKDPLSELEKVVGEWEGASSLLGPHTENGPNKVKKSKSIIPSKTSAQQYFDKCLSPQFKEEQEWASRRDWKRPDVGRRVAGTSIASGIGWNWADESVATPPSIVKANFENHQRRIKAKSPKEAVRESYYSDTKDGLLKKAKHAAPHADAAIRESGVRNNQFDKLKRDLNKQFRHNRKFVQSQPVETAGTAAGKIIDDIPKTSDPAKIASSLDDLIDVKKAKASLGLYATFGIMGLELLSAREKTPSLFGMAGAGGAAFALGKAPWWTQLGGAIVGYALGRGVGYGIGGIGARGAPEIDGLDTESLSGDLRHKNFDFFDRREGPIHNASNAPSRPTYHHAGENHPSNRSQRQWKDGTYNVSQPHTGSFSVSPPNRSMQRQHSPSISGLHEGGMAASERQMYTEFGSGWLSKAWGGIRKMFGGGLGSGGSRVSGLSKPLTEILTRGGATGRDFSRKRMSGSRASHLIEGYLEQEGVTVIKGQEALRDVFNRRWGTGPSAVSGDILDEKVKDVASAGASFIEDLNAVYITDSKRELREKAFGTGSRLKLMAKGKFRAAFSDMEDMRARLLGHESLEQYFTTRKARGKAIASHQTPEIYRSEAELAAMLGPTTTDYVVKRRVSEFDRLASQYQRGIEADLLDSAGQGLTTGGEMNKLIDPEKRINLAYLRRALSDTKKIYKEAGVLSKRSLGNIEVTERFMAEGMAAHASRVEQMSDAFAGADRQTIRRYADSTRDLKVSRRRVVSQEEVSTRVAAEIEILRKKKQLGKINAEAQVQEAANTRNSISRASKGRNVPGMPETGEAARRNRDLGYHSGIDPFRKYLAKIGKNFNEVRESVHFQRALREGTVLETVGAGGMGSVRKMEVTIPPEALGLSEEHVGKIPKLKYLRKEYTTEYGKDFSVASMEAERKGLEAIEDTLGPSVYGAVSVDDAPFMFMEHLEETTTLKEYLKKGNKLTDKQFTKVEDAIGLMHQRGIAHGDLSAKNILINKQGQPFVIDPAPSRLAPGGSLSAIDPHARELSLLQDKVGLEELESAVNRQFDLAEEAVDVTDRMWFASNINTLRAVDPESWMSNLPGTFAEKREQAFSIFEKIKSRVRTTDTNNIFGIRDSVEDQMALATTTGHGQVPKNVAVAVNQSDTVATAIDAGMRPKVHFNQRNQELMRHSAVTQGNTAVTAVTHPGRRHRNMQASEDGMMKVLEGVNLFNPFGNEDD